MGVRLCMCECIYVCMHVCVSMHACMCVSVYLDDPPPLRYSE